MTSRLARVALVLAVALAAGGCGGVIPPPYTDADQQRLCARAGGWWHPDDLAGGFCEFQSPGMI